MAVGGLMFDVDLIGSVSRRTCIGVILGGAGEVQEFQKLFYVLRRISDTIIFALT